MPPQQSQPPPPICFCFSIKSIEPDFEIQAPRYPSPPLPYWEPPTNKHAFRVVDNTHWHYWYNGQVVRVPEGQDEQVKLHGTTSLFWCHDRQAFLQVPYDCTEINVGQSPGGVTNGVPMRWRKLSFDHRQLSQYQCISLLGYGYEKDELERLPSPSWIPKMLPKVYQNPQTPASQGATFLAGDLSIILGLTAFSVAPNPALPSIIGGSFRMSSAGTRWASDGECGAGSKSD